MFRLENGEDITLEEHATIIEPFFEVCTEYLEKKIVPNFVCFFIVTGYRRNALWQAPFDVFIGSALDMFNFECQDYATIKTKVTKILYNRYKLKVISDDPLDFEEVSEL